MADSRLTWKENSEISTEAQVEQPKNGLDNSLSAVSFLGIEGAFFLQHCIQLILVDAALLFVAIAGKSDRSKT